MRVTGDSWPHRMTEEVRLAVACVNDGRPPVTARKWEWYWHGRFQSKSNDTWGWLHGGKCLLAWRLEGHEAEPETTPEAWSNKKCIVCEGSDRESD
jgi:hypothetical protein